MPARPVIMDCDPGVDDAVALLLAFAVPQYLELLGVTTVAGNVGAELTARNARLIRELAGRAEVPVFRGRDRPLRRPPVEADHFHGPSGLGPLAVFEPAAPAESVNAVEFLVATLSRRDDVTLLVTGPLTNVACALQQAPQIASRVAEIILMGGARREGGNITASAEYNIYADPDAAAQVFASGCPIVAIGLDATHQVRATPERVSRLRALRNPRATAVAQLLQFSNELAGNAAFAAAAPLHDPCTVAYVLNPGLFKTVECEIQVETVSPLTLGHTAVEFRLAPDHPGRTHWATEVDAAGVFELLCAALVAS